MFWLVLVVVIIAASFGREKDKRRLDPTPRECGCILCSVGEVVGIKRADF